MFSFHYLILDRMIDYFEFSLLERENLAFLLLFFLSKETQLYLNISNLFL